MPPTKIKTSVGFETPQQTVNRARNLTSGMANSSTASTVQNSSPRQSTGFTVPMPDTVPAEALNGNVGRADVRSMRDTMEQNNLATEQFNTDYSNLMGRVKAPLGATPFQDPQAFIEQTLLRRSTDTQNNLDQARAGQADSLRKMSGDLTETRNDAVTQFGLPDLQANLADTRNRIAERTNQLRTTLRDFETNAERRGVAREFVESEKGKVQADAAAELADLAIIESAQAGNVAMAQEDIDRAVEAKVQAFQFENAAIEAEITRLEEMDTRESAARSEQLQIALQERTRNIEQAIADEKQKLTYLSEAAANGADQGTLDAIRKATNVGEAAMMAGPFIGRLDRQAKQASTAASWALANERMNGGESITTPSGEQLTVPTFEEFITEKQNELGMSLTPQSREQYRKEYEDEKGVMEQAVRVSSLSPVAQEVVNNPQAYYDLTPTLRGEVFEEMAKKGVDTNAVLTGKKKSLPATQAESLAQAAGVKSDVEKLYTMLQELPGNGPISGRLQALDPYNAKRVAINAQITRIVPGLARGIFNEVGVLTDSDVTRYRDTLANPNMTDEQIEALHKDTLSKIEQSIGTTVDTFSSLGYDLGTYGKNETKPDELSLDEAYAEYQRITKGI